MCIVKWGVKVLFMGVYPTYMHVYSRLPHSIHLHARKRLCAGATNTLTRNTRVCIYVCIQRVAKMAAAMVAAEDAQGRHEFEGADPVSLEDRMRSGGENGGPLSPRRGLKPGA